MSGMGCASAWVRGTYVHSWRLEVTFRILPLILSSLLGAVQGGQDLSSFQLDQLAREPQRHCF